MITPLDYTVNPHRYSSINFPTHEGAEAVWSYITDCEHNSGNDEWCSDQWAFSVSERPLEPDLRSSVGSDPYFFDEEDGSFNVPFARTINQASRRFSPS